MTVNRGPGVQPIAGVGTTTVEHRLMLAGLYAENSPGVPRSGVLSQATSQLVTGRGDMAYDVGPAALVIGRTAAEGVYTPTLTGITTVATGAAPATNSRWDLIYVKQNDQAKGDADNQAVIGVQQGIAAASPNKPTGSLPAGAYVLAEARIFAETTGTNGGSNTIAQVWRHTAARGAPVPIRTDDERAEITAPAVGQQISRKDINGRIETWNGTTWWWIGKTESFTRAAGPDSNAGDIVGKTGLVFSTITNAPAGNYRISGRACLYANSGTVRGFLYLQAGSTVDEARNDFPGDANPRSLPSEFTYVHAGGDLAVEIGYRQSSGSPIVTGITAGVTRVTATLLGN